MYSTNNFIIAEGLEIKNSLINPNLADNYHAIKKEIRIVIWISNTNKVFLNLAFL